MKTREINKFLSTEKYLLRTLLPTTLPPYPHYLSSPILYHLDLSLITSLSTLKESLSIQNLAYLPFHVSNLSTKSLHKYLISLLKKHFSTKLLVDDTRYLSTVVKALGNTLNFKVVAEAVSEIMRQGKVELSRSMGGEGITASHNYGILKAVIIGLTKLYEGIKTVVRQVKENEQVRKAEGDRERGKKEGKQIQVEGEVKKRVAKEGKVIKAFIKGLQKYEVLYRVIDIHVLQYRFTLVSTFFEDGFMNALYHGLCFVNDKVEKKRPELAIEYAK